MNRVTRLVDHLNPKDLVILKKTEFDQYFASISGSHEETPKVNQDAFNFTASLCIVCDGHGECGELVSDLVSKSLIEFIGSKSEQDLAQQIQKNVKEKLGDLAQHNGCTGVWVRRDEEKLLIANVGDSRCVVIDENNKLIFETRDHKPDDPIELERIYSSGGVVTKRFGDVPRVAGLALSRSFGDFYASSKGVNAVPDVSTVSFDLKPKFVILASDGVWDMMTSSEIVNFVVEHQFDLLSCAEMIISTCRERWAIDTGATYCDDITCAIWKLNL